MSLQEELAELEQEIASLQEETGPLQEKYDQLFREVSVFEAENKHKKLVRPVLPRKMSHPHNNDIDDEPALIHHSHFDASIEKYFRTGAGVLQPQEPVSANDAILAKIQLKTTAGQLALRESILRFGGITAFAINDRLYDAEDDALLGLRFDILCHQNSRFQTPHYIILRRRQFESKDHSLSENKWLIFRYTTPPYVPLDQLSAFLMDNDEDTGLQNFVENVRDILVSVQYKHDKLDQISSITYETLFGTGPSTNVVTKLEKDLECRRVLLSLQNHNLATRSLLEIELWCSKLDLESVICRFGQTKDEIFVQTMLHGCSFQNLDLVFHDVVKYLRQNRLI